MHCRHCFSFVLIHWNCCCYPYIIAFWRVRATYALARAFSLACDDKKTNCWAQRESISAMRRLYGGTNLWRFCFFSTRAKRSLWNEKSSQIKRVAKWVCLSFSWTGCGELKAVHYAKRVQRAYNGWIGYPLEWPVDWAQKSRYVEQKMCVCKETLAGSYSAHAYTVSNRCAHIKWKEKWQKNAIEWSAKRGKAIQW